MKIIKRTLFIFIILCFNYSYAQDAQEIIKKVQTKYNGITDAQANFSQSVKFSSGKAQSSSGVIYIKKENKYRIESKNEIVLTDGSTSWSYSKKKKQVIIDYYKNDGNTFSPNKFLFNYPENFYSDYESTETISGKECYLLKLSPRNKGSVKSAKIWVDKEDDFIRKITIVSSENTTTYTLTKISLDAGISSSKFSFSPPEGVEVIDLR